MAIEVLSICLAGPWQKPVFGLVALWFCGLCPRELKGSFKTSIEAGFLLKSRLTAWRRGDQTTVKPVLSGHSKIDKTKFLMTNGSLMKVKSIAECSKWSILQYV